jgi:hypothetical protein
MKRLNPSTGLPFKRGDIREDGYVFYQYRKIILKTGNYKEYWLKPKIFIFHNYDRRSGINRKIPELAATMLQGAKERCFGSKSRIKQNRKASNGKITIDKQWIMERLKKGVCEATGDILTLSSRQPNSPSLDRIDPKNPNYTPENCRITTWQFNNMKGAFSDEEFIWVAEALKNVKKNTTT